jgi:hypothetical protein
MPRREFISLCLQAAALAIVIVPVNTLKKPPKPAVPPGAMVRFPRSR